MYGGEKNQMISKTQKIKPKTCTWKFVLEKKKKTQQDYLGALFPMV